MAETTIGKMLINDAIPEDMRDNSRVFNKKTSAAFFQELAESYPDEYPEVLHRLNSVSRIAATEYGGVASLSLKDLRLPPKTADLRRRLRARVRDISQNPVLTEEQKQTKVVATVQKAMPVVEDMLTKELSTSDNAYGIAMTQGFRGKPAQIRQILFGDMLVADHKGNPVPIPGLHSYGEGVTPEEYWAGSYEARRGYSDVQFATAQTGFLGKQLAAMAQRIRITDHDCGAKDVGISVDGNDPEIMGQILARDIKDIPAGTIIGKEHLGSLRDSKPLVRSMLTCQQDEGICQKCYGQQEKNKFPAIGAFVGIDAARVISEPMTQQLALESKHTGGSIKGSDEVSGFEEVNQFVQIPKSFKGGAVLAPVEGKVLQIAKAPQGGHYMHVGDQQVYISPQRSISVRPGDKVEAGDVLTDGTPHPGELAKLKGLGEGRIYFQDKLMEILGKNGVSSHRRNVEAISRSFFDRVRITNPEGVQGYRIDDIVPYGELQKSYEPRPGAEGKIPRQGLGMYLERPVLHYTIGTRVTPRIAKELDSQGIQNIRVHKEHPGFEPSISRIMDIPGKDPDWKVRIGGFGIKKSFLDSARMGSTSKHKNTAPMPTLLDPSRL